MESLGHESDGIASDIEVEEDLDRLIDEHDDSFTESDDEDQEATMEAIENKMKQFQSHWRPPLKGSRYPDMESDLFSDHSE